ncbi:MAG: UDP-N-acetylglucosamine--N-acetylmuramyl-(pentapeptide) pyrophosphoryl-undecaprenol N-acetylglucosamine transferase [Parcubacteria group bacterium]
MANQKEIKIMLTAGGTAGHINPLLAVYSAAMAIKEAEGLKLRFTYIGDPDAYANKFKELGIPVKRIISSKLRRYISVSNLFEVPRFVLSWFESLWHMCREMPDILISKGGPSSLAPIIAARFLMIPVVIHESDAIPSVTTKISGRFAKKIFLAFEDARDGLRKKDQKKCEVVGNPLRPSLFENPLDKRDAKIALGFNSDKPLMLVLGGSQGSQRINNLITESLPKILELGFQVFHQTGAKLFSEVSGSLGHYFDSLEEMDAAGYKITDFFNRNIKEVLAAADLVISRAGSSLFEFAAFGIPSILIPLPEAAQNHQLKNALSYKKSGACIVMEEDEMSVQSFIRTLEILVSEKSRLKMMSEAAKRFAKPDAASKIAEKLIKLASDKN